MSLFRYIRSEYAESLLSGAVRFLPLSYYQQQEENAARGDPHEALRVFRPTPGLEVTKVASGEKGVLAGWSFQSGVQADDMFVYCMSRTLGVSLARAFECDVCVEIEDVDDFSRRLRMAAATEHPYNVIQQRRVKYYEDTDAPGAEWALPLEVVMRKRSGYAWQREYRFVLARSEMLEMSSTFQRLVSGNAGQTTKGAVAARVLEIGDIRSIARVHRFGAPGTAPGAATSASVTNSNSQPSPGLPSRSLAVNQK